MFILRVSHVIYTFSDRTFLLTGVTEELQKKTSITSIEEGNMAFR